MFMRYALFLSFSLLAIVPNASSSVLRHVSTTTAMTRDAYTKPHSLGDSYSFDPRDGWQAVNVTNLEYKYRRDAPQDFDQNAESWNLNSTQRQDSNKIKRSSKKSSSKSKTIKASASAWINSVSGLKKLSKLSGLKGSGSKESVKITWYTGQDLKNPSCWSNIDWAPTDDSFVCALTLEGWKNKPDCFKFLEVCHESKCVFVRVVDTCAGCAPGTRHVDLTKAAFGQLGSLDEGVMTVQMRPANTPLEWFEDLWGPQH
ncbi:hypothetical protein K435DRAFT_772096 [Dendrothele bispora CBS 962.96]|uniref:RlpA-like protein double-psi beta-barrel domain-containing protein n=1 Tax=Dendrothele bispora (strain CBS 962.96) TaxID=1314807 RepID=A0A4S8MYW0_DENBC|nr:hypothetical protein K435DRAFT_772096 [Dendrothele bispora CBS 962.96]